MSTTRASKQCSMTMVAMLIAAICFGAISPIGGKSSDPIICGNIGDENFALDTLEGGQGVLNISSADSGFRPEKDGFRFENYGSELKAVDMTSFEMGRMFGGRVYTDEEGTLLPNARRWMEEINSEMAGGHCEGMAVLSLLIYHGLADAENLGGMNTSDLDIADPELQKEIAYWWTTQATSPAYNYRVYGPVEVLRTLAETFKQGKNAAETWTMSIRKEDGNDGHAVTPFAVEDKGDGIYDILVYDNNFPGQTRAVEVNSSNDTFTYDSAINPGERSSQYTGHNLLLKGTNARLIEQECDFCEEEGSISEVNGTGGDSRIVDMPRYTQVWQDGGAYVLIKDSRNRRLGMTSDGTFVNEIPGAKIYGFLRGNASAKQMSARENSSGLLYLLPSGINYSVSLDGTEVGCDARQRVTTIGPGYYTEVEGIKLSNGTGQVQFSSSKDGSREVSCNSDGEMSPRLKAGVNSKDGLAYEFLIVKNSTVNESAASENMTITTGDGHLSHILVETDKRAGKRGGSGLYDNLDRSSKNEPEVKNSSINDSATSQEVTRMVVKSHSGKLKIRTDGRAGKRGGSVHYDLKAARLSKKGPEVFSHRGIALNTGASMIVDYAGWEGEGHAMSISIDENDDGNIDETINEPDEGGSYADIISSDDSSADGDGQDADGTGVFGAAAAKDGGTESEDWAGSSEGDTGVDSGDDSSGDSGGD